MSLSFVSNHLLPALLVCRRQAPFRASRPTLSSRLSALPNHLPDRTHGSAELILWCQLRISFFGFGSAVLAVFELRRFATAG